MLSSWITFFLCYTPLISEGFWPASWAELLAHCWYWVGRGTVLLYSTERGDLSFPIFREFFMLLHATTAAVFVEVWVVIRYKMFKPGCWVGVGQNYGEYRGKKQISVAITKEYSLFFFFFSFHGSQAFIFSLLLSRSSAEKHYITV